MEYTKILLAAAIIVYVVAFFAYGLFNILLGEALISEEALNIFKIPSILLLLLGLCNIDRL